MADRRALTPAEKMRRHRERKRRGVVVVPVEIPRDLQHRLVMADYLEPTAIGDADALALAVSSFLDDYADGGGA